MTISICDRCGDVTVEPELCRCRTPYDPVAVRRRHHQAILRAEETTRLEQVGHLWSGAA